MPEKLSKNRAKHKFLIKKTENPDLFWAKFR